jgi:4-phospho-D-threonate 3-dehydrogenase / 4-phospho-D-erythronate 3-dehydrogenase
VSNLPLLALTMGDPAGVGPELGLMAAQSPEVRDVVRLMFIGTRRAYARAAETLSVQLPWESDPERFSFDEIDDNLCDIPMGVVNAGAGAQSFEAVEQGIAMALDGAVDGLVTAPISKDAWHQSGVTFPGHTELLADRCGIVDFALMLVQDNWRVMHVSTHVSLRDAIDWVTRERIEQRLRLFDNILRELGCAAPSIGVAGLNPHAGEGGLFGDEESRIIAPAIEAVRTDGIDAQGPIPPDTVFARGRVGEFDGVLAMYHDQGHVAVKTLAFEPGGTDGWSAVRGVNMTVGLPMIRTSVDHGTAFDIAGTGRARPESMVEATLLAAQVASRRRAARGGL